MTLKKIVRDNPQLELQREICRHIDAKVRTETVGEVQMENAETTTILPI